MENDYFEEIYLLVADILQKHIPIDDVKNRINVLSMKYGEGIFPEIIFAKRERPWNDEYLCELKRMNITGACSKDFLLHMAEVSRYLYEKNVTYSYLDL